MNTTEFLYSASLFLNALENPFLFVALIVLGILLASLLRRSYGLVFCAAIGVTYVATELLKLLFAVARPEGALVTLDSYRFPSLHASIAGAFVVSIAWHFFFRTESVVARALVVLLSVGLIAFVSWTRLFLGVHELVDVLVGATLGVSITLLLHALMHHMIQR